MSTAPTPQDAPRETVRETATPTARIPETPETPETRPLAPTAPAPEEASRPAEVTYLPAPSGANWGLVVLGLVFVLVAAGVVANQLTGFQASQLTEAGPSVLVIGGLVCAAVGAAGVLARRR